MVKALLNSINNIPNTTAQLNSAASDNVSKTDFEKLPRQAGKLCGTGGISFS